MPEGYWPSNVLPGAEAAVMATPGAVRSGLTPLSPTRGPRLEKSASRSDLSTAPTVSAASALPGDSTVCSPSPSLPAATTKSVPVSAESRLTASSTGSVPGVSSPPRLRLTTSAPWATAHSMPAMTPDSSPVSLSFRTLPFRIFAPGATPLYLPPDLAPVPATMDATWVPWP